ISWEPLTMISVSEASSRRRARGPNWMALTADLRAMGDQGRPQTLRRSRRAEGPTLPPAGRRGAERDRTATASTQLFTAARTGRAGQRPRARRPARRDA